VEEWGQLCELLEVDSKQGLSKEDVIRTYMDKSVYKLLGGDAGPEQADKDWAIVTRAIRDQALQRFEDVISKDSQIEFGRKIQALDFSEKEIIIEEGGFAPGLLLLTHGICQIEGERFSGYIKAGSMIGGTCLKVNPDEPPMPKSRRTPSKAQVRKQKAKLREWLSREDSKTLFNIPSKFKLTSHTSSSAMFIPAATVLRTVAIEEKFNQYIRDRPEHYVVASLDDESDGEGEVAGEAEEGFDFDPENVKLSWQNDKNSKEDSKEPPTRAETCSDEKLAEDVKQLSLDDKEGASESTNAEADLNGRTKKEDMMLTTVHGFFDKDNDGFWNMKETCDSQQATEGVPMRRDEYLLICEMLKADPARGLSKEDVGRIYLDAPFKATMGMSDEMIEFDTLGKDYKLVEKLKLKQQTAKSSKRRPQKYA